jgi:hypothetical protein
MNPVYLLDESLQIEVFYSSEDADLADNICLKIFESCKEEEKIFIHDESDLFLTTQQARDLAEALLAAVKESETSSR